MSLMSAYSNDERVTRDQLAAYQVPPAQGRFHNPVGFHTYVEEVAEQLDRQGLVINSEEHIVGHEGQRHFGLMEIGAKEGELIQADDWSLFVALRGSHDQSVPRAIALGRSVMVCSNLMFSGDLAKLSTKQTLNVMHRLPGMIRQAVSHIPELAEREERRVDALQHFDMRPRWGDAALVEMHRRGALTAAQLGRAVSEWDRPTYEEHAEHGFNAWRLEQAVTEAAKPTGQTSNMFMIQDRVQKATTFIDEIAGFNS